RQGAADPADVRGLELSQVGGDPVGDLLAHPVGGGGHPGGDRLAERHEVGLEAVGVGVAAGTGADRVGLVDDEQGAVLAGQRPKGRPSSAPTQSESSVGSISVTPRRAWAAIASAVGAGEWPVIAPVSPRQKSTYSIPSTSVNRAPEASATKTGKAPAHSVIHG